LFVSPAGAALRTADTSGYWTNTATWSDATVPLAGDDVVINGGVSVTLDGTSADLSSVTNNGTITFVGTNTILRATNVTVSGTGNMTHNVNTDTDAPWVVSNRL
jgi:hypothetical protein